MGRSKGFEKITYEEANKYFSYNPKSGDIRIKKLISKRSRQKVGGLATKYAEHYGGYPKIPYKGRNLKSSRVAWLLYHGSHPPDHLLVDHINTDKADNRIENLRLVNHAENARNSKRSSANTSGVTGVTWVKSRNRYVARINVNGKTKHLGYHQTLASATLARKRAEREYDYSPMHGQLR